MPTDDRTGANFGPNFPDEADVLQLQALQPS
jgi:hypothetical protein